MILQPLFQLAKRLAALSCVSIVIALLGASAYAIPNGFLVDARGPIDPGGPIGFDTGIRITCDSVSDSICGQIWEDINIAFPGKYPFVELVVNDFGSVIGGPVAVPAAGFMYIDFDAPPSMINLTTFYGIDLDIFASDDDFLLGGVDAANPQFEMLSETYIGVTESYDADVSYFLTQSEYDILPQFAGFDFSRFGGDPSAKYYAFSATVPLDQFVFFIPEPTTFALIFAAAVGMLSAYRRESA